jgi:hypothetical protein
VKAWSRKAELPMSAAVSRAAVEGLSRQEVLQKALQTLSRDGRADRIGAWLEWPEAEEQESDGAASFRGMVWDRDNGKMPEEWGRLSPQPSLPEAVLISGLTVEQEMGVGTPMFGPLVGLRRAMWVPIERQGHLQGVLLAGSRGRHGTMPRALLESMASELSLAIGYEEEQQLARQRQADLSLARTILEKLAIGNRPERILGELVDNCTLSIGNGVCLGATFAVIGAVREEDSRLSDWSGARAQRHDESRVVRPEQPPAVDFRWTSGDPVWKGAVESQPASEIWRKALHAGQSTGDEPHAAWMRQRVARIVAIPLKGTDKILGVLVVGLTTLFASPEMLERLELRAALAGPALAAWKKIRKRFSAQSGANRNWTAAAKRPSYWMVTEKSRR